MCALCFTKTAIAEPHREEVRVYDVEDLIRKTFPENPDVMVAVAKCESGMRQFYPNGEIVTSHTRDFGLMQINEKYWDAKSKELGLDYKNNLEDNLKMARLIYEAQGENAWVCYQKMV